MVDKRIDILLDPLCLTRMILLKSKAIEVHRYIVSCVIWNQISKYPLVVRCKGKYPNDGRARTKHSEEGVFDKPV